MRERKNILNYTTTIEPEQTISEIQKLLSKYEIAGMMTEYEGRNVSAVAFKLVIDGKPLQFKLPCNWRAVREVFNKQGITSAKTKHKDKSLDNQAIRTAWRIILVWIEAQLALVEVNMVTLPQIFLPYAVMRNGKTLGEHISDDPNFLLGDGK